MKIYTDYFENEFIAETENFYERESEAFVSANPITEYMRKVRRGAAGPWEKPRGCQRPWTCEIGDFGLVLVLGRRGRGSWSGSCRR
jgi:hypothetical protein